MPPRHTKSEFASYLFPAWVMGQKPETKIIQATHTAELAVGFGRKVKNLIDSEVYRDVFPELAVSLEMRRPAGRWSTDMGGEYYAVGVGGALAGRGAESYVLLTILYLSRMPCLQPRWIIFTNGTHQARDSDYSRAARL